MKDSNEGITVKWSERNVEIEFPVVNIIGCIWLGLLSPLHTWFMVQRVNNNYDKNTRQRR